MFDVSISLVGLFARLIWDGHMSIAIEIKVYTNKSIKVAWNTSCSNYLSVTNGVKQGGVLSL